MRRVLILGVLLLGLAACKGSNLAPDAGTDGQQDDGGDGFVDGADDGGDDATGPWRSSLYPEDWTPGFTDAEGRFLHDFSYAGYQRGEAEPPDSIPGPQVSIIDQGADPSGQADSTLAVQAAIDQVCTAGGGRVFVPAGLYRVDGLLTVNCSGLVISGEGAQTSQIFFTRDGDMSGVSSLSFRGSPALDLDLPLVEDAQARSFEVTVAEPADLNVGDDVQLGALISEDFVAEHGMQEYWTSARGQWRAFFRRTVEAVDCQAGTCVVRLDVPSRYPLKVRDGASLQRVTGLIGEVGVEDLGLSNAVSEAGALACDRAHVLGFVQVKDAWVRRVETFQSPVAEGEFHLQSGGLIVQQSKRVSVSDALLAQAQNRGGGGNGYLFEIMQSSEVLIRDSQGRAGRHNFIQNWEFGASGCVFLRVRSEGGRMVEPPSSMTGLSETHHSLAMALLVDSAVSDDGWGMVNRRRESTGAGHTATQNVLWNMQGGLIRSYQFGWGYVIGTRDAYVYVNPEDDLYGQLSGSYMDTEPWDFVEGQDCGGELQPRSLYEDQLRRRLDGP